MMNSVNLHRAQWWMLLGLLASCGSGGGGGGGAGSGSQVDVSGTWNLNTVLVRSNRDCADEIGNSESYVVEFTEDGPSHFQLTVQSPGTSGQLLGTMDADHMTLSGILEIEDEGTVYTASLEPGSTLTFAGGTLDGRLEVSLRGDVECEQSLDVQGAKANGTPDPPRAGIYRGTWDPECFGCTSNGVQTVEFAVASSGRSMVMTFTYDFWGFNGNRCAGSIEFPDLSIATDGTFTDSGFAASAEIRVSGQFVSSTRCEGKLSFENGPGCVVVAEGPFTADHQS